MNLLILITNDDGVTALGIRRLIELMRTKGDVVVVAPSSHQSAMSHAITTLRPIFYNTIEKSEGYTEYSCDGTPVDCVKLALAELLDKKPDLVVSGINHGSNSSTNIIYSGTMGAAIEGAISGIPSIGFSLQDNSEDADFSGALHYANIITDKVLAGVWDNGVCLNVNVPKGKIGALKGIKVCSQSFGKWHEVFEKKEKGEGKTAYTLGGWFEPDETDLNGDDFALSQNYISIVPVKFDFTDEKMVNKLSDWNG